MTGDIHRLHICDRSHTLLEYREANALLETISTLIQRIRKSNTNTYNNT